MLKKTNTCVALLLLIVILAAYGCAKQDQETYPQTSAENPVRVSVDQVKQWMDRGDRLVFLDSRKGASWTESETMLPGAIRVPPAEVEDHLSNIPRDRVIVVYCT